MLSYNRLFPGEVCPTFRLEPDTRTDSEKAAIFIRNQQVIQEFIDSILKTNIAESRSMQNAD